MIFGGYGAMRDWVQPVGDEARKRAGKQHIAFTAGLCPSCVLTA